MQTVTELQEINLEVMPTDEAFDRVEVTAVFTSDGMLSGANENFIKTLGYTFNEIKGKFFSDISKQKLESLINKGVCECSFIKKDSKTHWFIGALLKSNEGVVFFRGFDINSIKIELQVRTDIMNITSIVSESDLHGNITSANEKFTTISQYTKDELLGKPHNFIRHPDMSKEVFKKLWATIGQGDIFRGIVKNKAKDGTAYYVDAVIAPLVGSDGKPEKYIGVRYDITAYENERQNVQAVLRAVEGSYAYIEFDTKGKVLRSNKLFQDVLGYTEEEMQSKHHSLFCERSLVNSQEYSRFWTELAAGKTQSGIFKRISKSGKEVWIQGSYAPVVDEVGRVLKVVKIATDVSAKVEVEQEVTKIADRVALKSQEIATQATKVASQSQSLGATTEEMNASIEELSVSIDSIAQNGKSADLIAKETQHEADLGSQAIAKSIEAMEMINKSSEEINEIVKVISEIASQTNLLAFNAAIEAARAGEHGLGFSVVADEVRKLAERSSQATKDITKLINESVKRVTQGGSVSKEAAFAFKKIVEGVGKTTQAISDIAVSAQEQQTAAKDVAGAIQQVADATEKSAASSDSIAQSTKELSLGAEQLRSVLKKFAV